MLVAKLSHSVRDPRVVGVCTLQLPHGKVQEALTKEVYVSLNDCPPRVPFLKDLGHPESWKLPVGSRISLRP